jgi:uncharacterized glyoxalase superfamily protein PhnB
MPWLSPHLTVRDAAAAIDFYQRAFGFAKKNAVTGPDGQILHAEMTWQDAVIMLGPEGAYGNLTKAPVTSGVPSPVAIYLYCDDVDAVYARATAAGAMAVFPPQDMFYGDRVCKLLDPDGHSWHFATSLAEETGNPTAH